MPTRTVFYMLGSWKLRDLRYGDMAYLIRSRDALVLSIELRSQTLGAMAILAPDDCPAFRHSLDPERRCEPDRAEVTPRIGNRGEEVVVDARQVTANVQANRRAAPTLGKLKHVPARPVERRVGRQSRYTQGPDGARSKRRWVSSHVQVIEVLLLRDHRILSKSPCRPRPSLKRLAPDTPSSISASRPLYHS